MICISAIEFGTWMILDVNLLNLISINSFVIGSSDLQLMFLFVVDENELCDGSIVDVVVVDLRGVVVCCGADGFYAVCVIPV